MRGLHLFRWNSAVPTLFFKPEFANQSLAVDDPRSGRNREPGRLIGDLLDQG
jgi:hypothetical protein